MTFKSFWCALIILIICLFTSNESIRLEIPEYAVSFCFHKMTFQKLFGCSLNTPKSARGVATVVHTVTEMRFQIAQLGNEMKFFIIEPAIFADESIMTDLINSNASVAGIIVFINSPCYSESCEKQPIKQFSEIDVCNDRFVNVFSNVSCSSGFEYYYKKFVFPVILLKNYGNFQSSIVDCYENHNQADNVKNQRCMIEVVGYATDVLTLDVCLNYKTSGFIPYLFGMNNEICMALDGINIYYTFGRKTTERKRIVLITTKMDSISMFDTGAHGIHEVLPPVAVLLYMLNLIKHIKADQYKNCDVLIAFLDNDSLYQSGSYRLVYDLHMNLVSDGIKNISNKDILFILSLDELYLLDEKKLFIYLSNCEKGQAFCKYLIDQISTLTEDIAIFVYFMPKINNIWLLGFDVPRLEVRDNAFRGGRFKNSFFDIKPIKSLKFGDIVGEVLVRLVFKILTNHTYFKQKNLPLTTDHLIVCLQNASCPTLSSMISDKKLSYYHKYANPFVTQSYPNQISKVKGGFVENRLSTFIYKMIIYLFHDKHLSSDCYDVSGLKNFSIDVQDEMKCFEVNMQIQTEFTPYYYMTYMPKYMSQMSDMPVIFSETKFKNNKVLVYIDIDADLHTTMVVMATFTGSLTLIGSIFVSRNINMIIPPEIF